jgi:ankyrin repeat protein
MRRPFTTLGFCIKDGDIDTLPGVSPSHWCAFLLGLSSRLQIWKCTREIVDAADQQGNTALHYAVESANYHVARVLVEDFKADANVPNRRQMRALHFAVDKSRPRLVRLLLDEGHADVNARDFQGNTPLILLTGLSASDLDEYANSDDDDEEEAEEEEGETRRDGDGDGEEKEEEGEEEEEEDSVSMRVARLLLARGADVNAANFAGMAALHQSMRRFDMDMMELLIAHGADVNGVNKFGDSPLHHAARLAMFPVIWQQLLRHGADPTARDRSGQTPLEIVPNDRLRVAVAEAIAAFQRESQA